MEWGKGRRKAWRRDWQRGQVPWTGFSIDGSVVTNYVRSDLAF